MAAFGVKHFPDDVGCKLIFYCHRVAWGSSLSTTCLLGGFQALSINPMSCRWAKSKFKSSGQTNSPCILSWVFHLIINTVIPMRITGQKKSRNTSVKSNLSYCSHVPVNPVGDLAFSILFVFMDVICLGLMLWASGFMVYFLHQHKRQVQYLYGTGQYPLTTPGAKATKSILTLVSTFVIFYSRSYAFEMQVYLTDDPQLWLIETSVVLTACFPALSPFLLLKSNSRASSLCSS